MNSFVLKIIACVCMFCDHFGDAFFGEVTFLNYFGRLSFTIFCFQIVQGYIHTHNIKKYISRLGLFALISQIPYMLFYHVVFNSFGVNVIFTLLFGLLSILIYDKYNKFVGIASCFALGIIAQFCKFDYGFWGVFIIFIFYLLREKKLAMSIAFSISVILKYYLPILKYGIPPSYLFWEIHILFLCILLFFLLSLFYFIMVKKEKMQNIYFTSFIQFIC